MSAENSVGKIVWTDLTVDNASEVRDFYKSVVGWDVVDTDMGGYSDFTMMVAGTEEPAVGVCHARGSNADLPPCWLIYVTVSNLDKSMQHCRDAGGEVIKGPEPLSGGRFAVIRDPAGATMALFQQ